MAAELLRTSIQEWLNPGTKGESAPVEGWSEDELNALARGLGCEEREFRADGTVYTYFLGSAGPGGSRPVYAFGCAGRALAHPPCDAKRLLTEIAPDVLGA